MSILKIIGATGYTRTGTRQEYTQDLGESTIITYKGPIEAIDDLYTASKADVQNGTVDKVNKGTEDGEGVLELAYADGDDEGNDPSTRANNTIWELVGQDIFKNLRSYGGDVAGSQAFNADANQSDLEDTRLYFESAKTQGAAPVAEPMQTYYKHLLVGTDQYVRSTAVLRATINVSRRSLITLDWKGVDRAWKIDGEEGSPNLDQTGQGALLGSLADMPLYDAGLKQWLKRAPNLTVAGKRRYTVTQEWWFAELWSANLYDGDIEP